MYGTIKVDTIIFGNDKILNISDILTKVDISDIYARLNEKVDKAYIDGNIEILQTKIDNIIKDVNDKIQELKDTKNKIEILEVEQNNLKINYNSLKQQTDVNTNDIQILKNDITQINIFNKDVDSRLDNLEANSQTANVDTLRNKIDNEISRAKSAENDLSLRINTEENRAKSEEKKLSNLIENETKRAIAKENELQSEIDNKAEKDDSRFASAYVLFDGTNGSILKSFNIEKVTKNDKGKYTISFNLNNPIPIISGNSSPNGASDTYTLKIDSLSNTELKIVNIGKTKDSSGNEVTSYEDSKIVSIVIF